MKPEQQTGVGGPDQPDDHVPDDHVTEQSDPSIPDADPLPSKHSPQRLGDVEKCPVCGSRVDGEAYHCPTCRNSFCFHCRASVLPSEVQYKCTNQPCEYYGKLLCDVCEERVEREEPPAIYLEPQEGYWPLLLVALIVAAGFLWAFWTSFRWSSLFVLVGFPAIGILLHRLGLNIFGRERRVEHRRTSRFYQCRCCQQQVKELPGVELSQNRPYGAGLSSGVG
ncbi:hypothetical protein Poly41_67530 [Novipirellula artificiosorum]|uniref:Uncharacterized protein n=1 Tax=Novipirellula artificiosorum TaxID=2528016 RepID=A0A5C6CZR9_9BACT|nr:hypothetical protein Poly41_67530 [Novipirellula artificiosorum]